MYIFMCVCVCVCVCEYIHMNRELYPSLLRSKDRGKLHNIETMPAGYGEVRAASGVAGSELLDMFEQGDIYIDDQGMLCIYV